MDFVFPTVVSLNGDTKKTTGPFDSEGGRNPLNDGDDLLLLFLPYSFSPTDFLHNGSIKEIHTKKSTQGPSKYFAIHCPLEQVIMIRNRIFLESNDLGEVSVFPVIASGFRNTIYFFFGEKVQLCFKNQRGVITVLHYNFALSYGFVRGTFYLKDYVKYILENE